MNFSLSVTSLGIKFDEPLESLLNRSSAKSSPFWALPLWSGGKTGEKIKAKVVVSNAGVKETILNLLPRDTFSKEYLEYIEHLSCGDFGQDMFMNNFLNIKVLLKKPVIEAPVVWGIPLSADLLPTEVELDSGARGSSSSTRYRH